jgi:spore germination protein GerM
MTSPVWVRRWTLAGIAVASVTGCGFPSQNVAQPVPEDDLPVGLRAGSVPQSTVPAETEPATVWLVDGEALVAARQGVAAPAAVGSVTAALLAGPNESHRERGFRSALPDPAVVVDAELARGVATVELAPSFLEISPSDQLLAVGQLVLTLTDLPGVGGVQFILDDSPIAVPIPTGETIDEPVFREQFLELTQSSPTS